MRGSGQKERKSGREMKEERKECSPTSLGALFSSFFHYTNPRNVPLYALR